jgi:competence protein ComGC
MNELIIDLFNFIKTRRKYWLIPLIIVFIIISIIVVFAENSALSPFIYTLF